ncbi:hypothetical protein G7Z17_g12570 [Cylindrodendrum hubeiense]|uniref:Uncharacterized protein n=1 Tax=Cylindrodendrum hubeiense TaxID=595255 RepID=A0A9P5GYR6_9HYPO|nr:hypothetical protein G7Z17_g12570 [Cylindrodendrum hubeiense]
MTRSKQQEIADAMTSLPLLEQPPKAPDWQSADARDVNVVGSGRTEASTGTDKSAESRLRSPSTRGANMDMGGIGREDESKE